MPTGSPASVSLMKKTRVALLSAHEKLEFQVTPMMPYLARFEDGTTTVKRTTEDAPRAESR